MTLVAGKDTMHVQNCKKKERERETDIKRNRERERVRTYIEHII